MGGYSPGAATAPQLLIEGRAVVARPVQADDVASLTHLLMRLSASTSLQRFLAARSFDLALAQAEAERIAAARTRDRLALVAVASHFGLDDVIGVVELARLAGEDDAAEVAVLVRDDMQARGVGSLLMDTLAATALSLGIKALHVELLAENDAMRRLAARVGRPLVLMRRDGLLTLRVTLGAPESQVAPVQAGAPARGRAA